MIQVQTSHDECQIFKKGKIITTLIEETGIKEHEAMKIARSIERKVKKMHESVITTAAIREEVNTQLRKRGFVNEARKHERVGVPVSEIKNLIRGHNTDNANLQRNPETFHKFVADAALKQYALMCLPEELAKAHDRGEYHIHDLEYFPARPINCCDGDTNVLIKLDEGFLYKTFKEIDEERLTGFEVYTYNHDKKRGEFKPVNALIKNPSTALYKVSISGGRSITVTKDHEFFKYNNISRKISENTISVEDALSNQIIGNIKCAEVNPVIITPFDKLVGFFLGDGSSRTKNSGQARFTLSKKDKIEFLINVLEEAHISYRVNKTRYTVITITNKEVNDWLKSVWLSNKKLPDKYLTENTVLGVLAGLISSDAHLTINSNSSKPFLEFKTTNKNIKDVFEICCFICGLPLRTHIQKKEPPLKDIFNCIPNIYSKISLLRSLNLRENQKLVLDGIDDEDILIYNKVKVENVKYIGEGPTYTFNVKDNHNYLAGEGLVLNKNCLQHDLRWFIKNGLKVDGNGEHTSVAAQPQRLETLMNHCGEIMLAGQQNCSGGQGMSLWNVFVAPFCVDMDFEDIKQKVQMFIYNLNMAYSNRGGQVPFTSINLEFTVPDFLKNETAWGKGGLPAGKYKDYEKEVRMLNRAFIEVMMEGDAVGKPHLFPNSIWVIRKEVLDDSTLEEDIQKVHNLSAKYSVPYFANTTPEWTGGHSNIMGSVSYDTKLLHRIDGVIDLKPACEVLIPKAPKTEVMTFNDEGKFEWKPIEIIIEKPPSPLYRIITKQGRAFKVTADHDIPVIKDGKVVKVKSENLSVGDELIQFTMPEPELGMLDQKDILTGIFIADGYIRRTRDTTQIEFHIKKDWKKQKIRELCEELDLEFFERGNHLIIEDKELRDELARCYEGKDKVIPVHYFEDINKLNGIVLGLEFDAHQHSSGRKHFYTSSEKLASQFMLALDLLGRHHVHYLSERNGWKKEYNISYNYKRPSKNIIKSIDLIENDRPVFDMQIKDNHNYVCGEGLVAIYNCRTRLNTNWTGDWDLDTLRTGNLAYVTLNLPRIAYKCSGDLAKFESELRRVLELGEQVLLMRRQHALKCLNEFKLLPFLSHMNPEGEQYYRIENSTLSFGFVGLHECLVALGYEDGLLSKAAQYIGKWILGFMNEYANDLTNETGYRWTILQTPGETTAHRFATLDKKMFPKEAIVKGDEGSYYYTNSSHVPVDSDLNLIQRIKIEEEMHPLTSGGHIFHAWIGESFADPKVLRSLTERSMNLNIGFMAYSGAFSFCFGCETFMRGLKSTCINCNCEDRIEHYDRVTGYIQQVGTKKDSAGGWNPGKRAELKDRFRHKV